MSVSRARTAGSVVALAWVGVAAGGCSGDDAGKSGTKCGPGTVEKDGTCVVAGTDGGGDARPQDGSGDGSAQPDPCASLGLRGSPMVEVKRPDGTSFCMDAFLVSVGDYADFLASGPTNIPDDVECAPNSFAPNEGCPFGYPAPGTPLTAPMYCLDWCDAAAVCAWAGKHLCTTPAPPSDDGGAAREAEDIVLACAIAEQNAGGTACTTPDAADACAPEALSDLLSVHHEWSGDCGIWDPNRPPCCSLFGLDAAAATCSATEVYCPFKHMEDYDYGTRCCSDLPPAGD